MKVFGSHIKSVENNNDTLLIKLKRKINFEKFNNESRLTSSTLILESNSPSTLTLTVVSTLGRGFASIETTLLDDIEVDTWWVTVNTFLDNLTKEI